MSDLTASLELQFGVEAEPPTFTVEADDRDAHLNKPIEVEQIFTWHLYQQWTHEDLFEYMKEKEVLNVISNGARHMRVYAPLDYDIEMITTDPPVGIAGKPGWTWQNYVPAGQLNDRTYFAQPPAFWGARNASAAPPTWQLVGVYEDIVHDTITFNNQRIAYMKYNYVKVGFEVAFSSNFFNKVGATVPPPVWYPDLNGAFVASEPCTGAMVLRYPVQYRLFKVNYGMAAGAQWPHLQLAWINGNIHTFPIPPVLVMAMSRTRGRAAQASFNKDVYPPGAWAYGVGRKKEDINKPVNDTLTEKSRITEEVQVFDPEDDTKFINVKRAKEVVLQDKDGKSFTWKLTPE